MDEITIEAALEELSVLRKEIDEKSEIIFGNLNKYKHPTAASKGITNAFISQELQAIEARQTRYKNIEAAIAASNATTLINVLALVVI